MTHDISLAGIMAETKSRDEPQCRFCGTSSIWEPDQSYSSLRRQEVYAGMIKNCFGIEVSRSRDQAGSVVCSLCLNQLQQAINFKTQIVQSEQAMEQRMSKIHASKEIPDKHSSEDEMSDGLDDVLDEPSLFEYYKLGKFIEFMNRRQLPKAPTGYTPRTVVGNDLNDSNTQRDDSDITCRRLVPNIYNVLRKEKQRTVSRNSLDASDQPFTQAANASAIVTYSYVCPFKNRYNHIMCYYCDEYYLDPVLLREHTMTHDETTFRPARHGYTKVDLTRIDCRLCPQKIESLKDFKRHLVSHGKKYFFGSKDRILPFKLVENENKCAVCGEQFSYFCALYKHINQHFSNFMCETCGVGFMDVLSLQKHRSVHDEKRYICIKCGKTFKTEYNRLIHCRRVHEKTQGSFCTKCSSFLYLHEKSQHMVEVHGESPTVTCIGCDQVFKSRRLLTIHVRREHMKDYRYKCQFCHKKFFAKSSLTLHLPTHTGERNFRCKVCEKSYPRLKTLKEHMRIHNMDKRYRCHICGQAFVQNCSLKGHLKNKHPENGLT